MCYGREMPVLPKRMSGMRNACLAQENEWDVQTEAKRNPAPLLQQITVV